MKKQILIALIGTALAAPFAVQAQNAYVGGNIGRAEQKLSGVDGSLKDKDTSFKLYGGMMFDKTFGAEIGFVNFGKAESVEVDGTFTSKVRAFYAAGTAAFPLNEQFSLTAKVGVSANRVKESFTGDADIKENRTSLLLGIGAKYNFAPNLAAVIEYENFGKVLKEEGETTKVNMLSVGIQYKF